jgi:predicted ArsR family transcriptional regulator
MDRLAIYKVLGDDTRYAIYRELAASKVPMSTVDLAEAVGLHINTVRPHLERMREIGLLELAAESRGTVGRPQHRYSLAEDAPSLGLEPPSFRVLATLLATVAASGEVTDEVVRDVGRQQGRALAEGVVRTHAIDGLLDELVELGFEPRIESESDEATCIAFGNCPFAELAEAFPQLVCGLHRGICEGFVDEVGGSQVSGSKVGRTRVVGFSTIEDRLPCRVDLSV